MTNKIEEINDIDGRIGFRSIVFTGNFSVYEALNLLFQIFASRLKFFKSLSGLRVKQVFESIEDANRISEVYRGSKIFPSGYREEFLKFLAVRLMCDKRILYCIPSSKKGGFLGLAVIPIKILSSSKAGTDKSSFPKIEKYIRAKISFQESNQMLREIADCLRDILKQELGQERWNKILEMKADSGLLRRGPIKGWPWVGDIIYKAYTILLPIYPSRAHVYGLQKWKGEKTKYPKALLKDLVQLFQERFQEDFKDLTESDVRRAIQYRMEKRFLSQYLF